MTPIPHPIRRRAGLLLLALCMPLAPLRAEEPAQAQTSPREILRDALYAEEVTRDATKAAEHYSKVLELYRAQQPFAATALFRLAEVRRKQGNKEEAAKLYQQLLREFPSAEVEGKLARENLTAMGGAAATPEAAAPADGDEESKELRRLQELARTSPDLARDPALLRTAATKGQSRVMAFLIDSGIDPQSGEFLSNAVLSGNLKAVEFLISKGCHPGKAPHDAALSMAVQKKFHSIAELLLKSGANANFRVKVFEPSSGRETSKCVLHYAAGLGDERMCRLLLDHGADPNFMPQVCYIWTNFTGSGTREEAPLGSPLHQAISADSERVTEVLAMLLKAGAKPGLAAATTGMTPLHFAAKWEKLPALRLLLEAGAPVNAQTLTVPDPGRSPNQWSDHKGGATALQYAMEKGGEEAARLLLAKGADPNLADDKGSTALAYAVTNNRKLVPLLLQHGAKAASPELLDSALRTDVSTVKLLLDAGADPNKPSKRTNKSPLQAAVEWENTSVELIQLLLDRGAKADESWLKESMRRAKAEVRSLLTERFILPELLTRPAVTLTYADLPGETWTLAKREGEAAPGQLESLLMQGIKLPQIITYTNRGNRTVLPDFVTIHRKEAGGAIKKIEGRLDGSAAMPKLEWGDVVELNREPSIDSYNSTFESLLAPEVFWNLRRHVAVPITVNLAGQPQPLTLRGNCLVYHPGEAVVPVLRAGRLAQLLWSRVTPDALSIRRAAWPEIRIAAGTAEWDTFEFQAGDEVTPVYRKELAELENTARKEVVTLTVPGTTFAKTWHATHPPTAPTLVEVIADLYASWQPLALGDLPEDSPARWGVIAARQQDMPLLGWNWKSLAVPAIPDHPDFSKIRIHRRPADGGESILEVDLSKAFAAATSTRDEAMKYDVKLQAGDLIELPQRKREGSPAWKGFSEEEARYFGKVLSSVYQVTDGGGTLRRKALVWQPAKWVDSPDGPVPLPPEPGVASSAASYQTALGGDGSLKLAREGMEEGEMGVDFFIRDGDRLRTDVVERAVSPPNPMPVPQLSPQQPIPQQQGGRPNRQRVLPPSPSR